MKLKAAAGILLIVWSRALAESRPEALEEAWRWAHFTTESGLPSNRIYSLLEDSAGTVWAGTDVGVAWYDGFQWHAIRQADGLPENLPAAMVRGPGGEVVVATGGRLFRGGKQGFGPVPLRVDGKVLFISAIYQLSQKRYLLFGRQGQSPTATLYHYDFNTLEAAEMPDVSAMLHVRQLWSGKGGQVWLNTDPGLFCLGENEWKLKLKTSSSPLTLKGLVEDESGNGLLYVDYPFDKRGVWEWRKGEPPRRSPTEGKVRVTAMDMGPSGEAVLVYESGVVRIRRGSGWSTLHRIPAQLGDAHFIQFRTNGDLWVGTGEGLLLNRRSLDRWTHWKHDFPDQRNSVHEILRSRDGSIWLGTGDGIEVRRPDDSAEWIRQIGNQRLFDVTGLAEDQEGAVWISSGSSFDGAFRWNGSEWRHFGRTEGLPAGHIHRIRRDRRNRPWFLGLGSATPSSNAPGAFLYAGGRFIRWGEQEGLPNGRVYSFAEAEDGSLWFGTAGGLSRWKQGSWTHWTSVQGLRTERIFALAVDRFDKVWFADQSSGLGFIDEWDKPRFLTTEDGLVSNEVWNMSLDDTGVLWVATHGGLSSYKEGIWCSFRAAEGLPGLRLWPVLPVGSQIYVGTSGSGTSILRLEEKNDPPPRVQLGEAFLEEQTAHLNWRAFTHWGQIAPLEVPTRYRWDDTSWSKWGPAREVTIDHLSPGSHTFEVQAKGLFGNHNASPARVRFSIEPPFYRSPEFLAPVGILSVAVLVLSGAILVRRRQSNLALLRSAQEYRNLFAFANDAIVIADPSGSIIDANGKALKFLGYSKDELLQLSIHDLHPEEERSYVESLLERLRSEGSLIFEYSWLRKDGTRLPVEISARLVDYGGRRVLQGFIRDISERKKASAILQRSESRNRALIEAIPDLIFRLDKNGVFLDFVASQGVPTLVPPEDFLGKAIRDVLPAELSLSIMDAIRQCLATKEPQSRDYDLALGSEIRFYEARIVASSPDEVLAIVRDVTETRKAEEERARLEVKVQQAQKLESIGLLAGGIAHDFNNFLQGVQGNLSLALMETPSGSPHRRYLEEAETAAQRAAELTKQILAYSGQGHFIVRAVDLNRVVKEMVHLLETVLSKKTVVRYQLSQEPAVVEADPNQIRQVVMNLLINASEAMDNRGGAIQLITGTIHCDKKYLSETFLGTDLKEGNFVFLEVSDRGCGIDAKVRQKIFDPFFTTKFTGRGLGLAAVLGIVRGHAGAIAVDSEVGKGTTFRVLFPPGRYSDSEAFQPEGVPQPQTCSKERPGSGTILVVEDDASVRLLAQRMLERHGFQVLTASNGLEGFQLFSAHCAEIVAVLLDMTMPQLNGEEALRKMRTIRSDTPIILSSGYTESEVRQRLVRAEPAGFIQKPYQVAGLIEVVSRAITASMDSSPDGARE
ncbi:MAG: PAS domain S-box protein [Acidobacteriota bacterium]